MVNILTFITFLIFTSSSFASSSFTCNENETKILLSKLEWITEDYPPYNFHDKSNQLVGVFPEALRLVYEELDIKLDINSIMILPWSRLLMYMDHYPKFASFSMVTTPARAIKYKLVSLPVTAKISIMVLRSNSELLKNKNFNELSVAVVRGDIGQRLLNTQKIPVKQIETVSAFSMLKMLLYKRVDAIAYSEDVAFFKFEQLGADKNLMTSVFSLDDHSKVNFAFNKATPNCVIEMFTEGLATLQIKGKIRSIWNKYVQE
jgi:ABC-type amino acid transport substrate-binding protein